MTPFTWNADQERVGETNFRTRIGVKWRNFLGELGWERIDLAPREAGGLFTISKAPYSIDVPKSADGWSILSSTNRYDIHSRRVMPDQPVSIAKRYLCEPVQGELVTGGILFAGALPGLNADRFIQFHEQEVRDLIVFRSEPPGSGPVEVPIEFDHGKLDAVESMGRGRPPREADFGTEKLITHGVSFTTSRFRGVKAKAPRVWDSAGRSAPIAFRLRHVGSRLVGAKVIPRSFFALATFPVYADTTSTFYPDPDTESTSVDGDCLYVEDTDGVSWAAIRDATDASQGLDSQTTIFTYLQANSSNTDNWSRMGRAFLLFDTSAIPNGDTVTAATLGIYVTLVEEFFGDSIALVDSTPASNTAITAADYDQLGTTLLANARTISGLSVPGYNTFSLNATGIAAINLTGVTKLGLRQEYDRTDSPPSWTAGEDSLVEMSSADHTGTSQDPYLEVVHASLTDYEIDADVAAFTLTGQAAGLRHGHRVSAATGAFALSGQAANLKRTHKMPAATGSYTLTGNAAALVKSLPPLAANTGTFTLTGVAASLLHGFEIAGATGVFSLTANAVTLTQTYPLLANTATFTLTGNAAGVYVGRKITAAVATYTLTGVAATLSRTRVLRAATGSFTETANAAGLRVARLIRAATGTFILTGNAVTMIAGYPITAAVGAFTLTGVAAGLRVTRYLAMATGSYALTGVAASLERGFKIVASAGSFTETANAAALERGKAIVAATGEFTVSGQAASLLYQRRLAADAEAFEVEAQDATLQASRLVVCASGTFTQTGQAASLFVGRAINAEAAAFVETANDATLKATRTMPAATGVFTETGQAAELEVARAPLSAEAAEFTQTANAAGLRATRLLVSGAGAFTFTANDAGLGSGRTLAAGAASFTFAGRDATLLARRLLVLGTGTYVMTANPAGLALVDGRGHAILAKISIEPRIRAALSLAPRIWARITHTPRIRAALQVSP